MNGSAVAGGVISETVWPASVRAATVVDRARSIAGVGGTTPELLVVGFGKKFEFDTYHPSS